MGQTGELKQLWDAASVTNVRINLVRCCMTPLLDRINWHGHRDIMCSALQLSHTARNAARSPLFLCLGGDIYAAQLSVAIATLLIASKLHSVGSPAADSDAVVRS